MPRKPYEGEKRESRLSLLIVPSLYKDFVTLADSQGLSINELMVRLIQRTVDKNRSVIDKFQEAKNNAKLDFVDIE